MKIKSIESFTKEECLEYLHLHPNGAVHESIKARINAIEVEEAEQNRLEQAQFTENVKWMDIKQFREEMDYLGFVLNFKFLMWPILLIAVCIFLFFLGILAGWMLIIIIIINGMIIFGDGCYNFHREKNIESEEKIQSYRRTQDRRGKWGLFMCGHELYQELPPKYDNIYYCGGKSFICVIGNKFGVYSTEKSEMVIKVEYDSINMKQDGTLETYKNGVRSRFTTEGYRIIE